MTGGVLRSWWDVRSVCLISQSPELVVGFCERPSGRLLAGAPVPAVPKRWVAKPTIRPTIEPGTTISQRYGPPRVTSQAKKAPTTNPKARPSHRFWTLRANQPIKQTRHQPFDGRADHDAYDLRRRLGRRDQRRQPIEYTQDAA